ncbi:MAG: DUF4252 domain-containing protein [Saprospiraceae bacterium]|nr:DUF4252 domain-containing protein [Saprospiraceae bacterium]
MKNTMLIVAMLFAGASMQAQDYGLHWKYKDYPGAITFSVSDPFIHMGSWFVEDDMERRLLNKVDKVRVMVFEDYSPVSNKDIARFNRKAAKRRMEDLVMVRTGHTYVRVMIKEKNEAIRKVVVFVQDSEAFVLAAIRGKLRYKDLNEYLRSMEEDFHLPEIDEWEKAVKKRQVTRV